MSKEILPPNFITNIPMEKSPVPYNPQLESIPVPLPNILSWKLNPENVKAFDRIIYQLKLRPNSPSTIRTYQNELFQLLRLLNKIGH